VRLGWVVSGSCVWEHAVWRVESRQSNSHACRDALVSRKYTNIPDFKDMLTELLFLKASKVEFAISCASASARQRWGCW
jgi:hypothetical protein